jgi:NAD(P)-dependent dehydrogenase (short-subunit alcohol dehydrogenase family)
VVNVGSFAGLVVPKFYGAYAASKFALEAITDAARLELGAWNISVSLLQPGGLIIFTAEIRLSTRVWFTVLRDPKLCF